MSLDKKFIETQKEYLVSEKKRIENRIAKLKKYPQYDNIGEDNMQEIVDYENNLSIDEQLEFLLSKINKALVAIEKGTYGQCSKCKTNIEEGRLEIMPYSDLCVTCEAKKK
jgi:RNA polymerase-binding transcription factor DksA